MYFVNELLLLECRDDSPPSQNNLPNKNIVTYEMNLKKWAALDNINVIALIV